MSAELQPSARLYVEQQRQLAILLRAVEADFFAATGIIAYNAATLRVLITRGADAFEAAERALAEPSPTAKEVEQMKRKHGRHRA